MSALILRMVSIVGSESDHCWVFVMATASGRVLITQVAAPRSLLNSVSFSASRRVSAGTPRGMCD
eukprot:15078174-Heterocapsa_arctica.AAC.1